MIKNNTIYYLSIKNNTIYYLIIEMYTILLFSHLLEFNLL